MTYFYWMASGLPVGVTPKAAGFPKLDRPKEVPSPERGAKVYASSCALCHGEDGLGGHGGGAPLDQVKDPNLVVQMVNDGRGSMPPLSGLLSPQQIRAVAAYVTSANGLFK